MNRQIYYLLSIYKSILNMSRDDALWLHNNNPTLHLPTDKQSAHPLWCEVAGERCALVRVKALAAVEELWQEGWIKSWEIYGGHVIEGQSNVILQEVMALVQENLQQHIDEMEEHGVPE